VTRDPFLDAAIEQAEIGRASGGIPIGSVLVRNDEVVGRGHNQRVQKLSAVLHAEMDCLENAGRLTAADYLQSTIYSTLSPCSMCTGAILLYGIPRVVVGERTTFRGPQHLLEQAGVEVVVLNDEKCIAMMRSFIEEHPDLWNEDIGK
jgi:cytosine/creatinine deaminase